MVIPASKGHKYSVDHHNGLFIIKSNKEIINNAIYTADSSRIRYKSNSQKSSDASAQEDWTLFYKPNNPKTFIKEIEVFEKFMVVWEHLDGQMKLLFFRPNKDNKFESDSGKIESFTF